MTLIFAPTDPIPPRLEDELTNLRVEVLSARCIVHRLRRRRAEVLISQLASPEMIGKALQDVNEVKAFFQEVKGLQGLSNEV